MPRDRDSNSESFATIKAPFLFPSGDFPRWKGQKKTCFNHATDNIPFYEPFLGKPNSFLVQGQVQSVFFPLV